MTMTATARLKHWQRAAPGRHVYFGRKLVALGDGERSLFATGESTEDAARVVLEAWYALPSEDQAA